MFDRYKATIKLSKDFKDLIVHCYKPEEDEQAKMERIRKQKKLKDIMINNNQQETKEL